MVAFQGTSVNCFQKTALIGPKGHEQALEDLTFLCCFDTIAASVELLSRVQLFVTPWPAAHQASLFITNSPSLLKLKSTKSVHPSVSSSVVPFPACNLSQHQGLFQWVSSSHQVARVLEFQVRHQSFQWIFRTDFLQDGLVGSPCSPRDSQESSLVTTSSSYKRAVVQW